MTRIFSFILLMFLSLLIVSCSDFCGNPPASFDSSYDYDIEFTNMSVKDSVVSFIKKDTFHLGIPVVPFVVFNKDIPEAGTYVRLHILFAGDSLYWNINEVPENFTDDRLRFPAFRIRLQGRYEGIAEFIRDDEVYATVRKSFFVIAPYTR